MDSPLWLACLRRMRDLSRDAIRSRQKACFFPRSRVVPAADNATMRKMPNEKNTGREHDGVAERVTTAIDPAVFRRLKETMEDELPTLVEDFIAETATMLADLADPVVARDAVIVTRHAHTLKSSAAMVGAQSLSALARTLEAQSAKAAFAGLGAARAAMEDEFARVRDELERFAGAGAVNG